MNDNIKEFNKWKGEILSSALSVESNLEIFIADYLFEVLSEKRNFFIFVVLQKLDFNKKVEIFKEICKRNLNKEDIKNIFDTAIKSIRYVQEIRNKVAHWETHITAKNEIQLQRRTDYIEEKDMINLDENLIKNFKQSAMVAIFGIRDLSMKVAKIE